MTSLVAILSTLLLALVLTYTLAVILKLYRKCRIEDITPDWLENFSVSTYQSMDSLLADDDFSFLSRQPGFDLALHKKLRKERLHIFRQYLSRLILDFNRLHMAARVLLAHTSEDHSDVVSRLIWLKVRFTGHVLQTEFRYVLCLVGLSTLEVRALLQSLEEMNSHLLSISAAQAA